MIPSRSEEAGAGEDQRPELSWSAHPLRRQRGRGLAAVGVILIISFGLATVTGSSFWGVFSCLMLVFSLEGFFFPTRYRLAEDEVEVRRVFSRSTRGWETFRRVYNDANGITLSPYRRRSALEPYRSLRLLFDGGEPERIRGWVRNSIGDETEWIDLQRRKA